MITTSATSQQADVVEDAAVIQTLNEQSTLDQSLTDDSARDYAAPADQASAVKTLDADEAANIQAIVDEDYIGQSNNDQEATGNSSTNHTSVKIESMASIPERSNDVPENPSLSRSVNEIDPEIHINEPNKEVKENPTNEVCSNLLSRGSSNRSPKKDVNKEASNEQTVAEVNSLFNAPEGEDTPLIYKPSRTKTGDKSVKPVVRTYEIQEQSVKRKSSAREKRKREKSTDSSTHKKGIHYILSIYNNLTAAIYLYLIEATHGRTYQRKIK